MVMKTKGWYSQGGQSTEIEIEYSGIWAELLECERVRTDLANWITHWWGERCPDYYKGCQCCEAWVGFDAIFAEIPEQDEGG